MTIKEALKTKTKTLNLTDGEIDLALLEAGLDGTDNYDPAQDAEKVDKVWGGLLLTTIQVTEVREDDVAIKYSTELRGIYSWLAKKWGWDDPFAVAKPTVKQIVRW